MSGFTFKQFHINHEQCAMKVGTDGILLGAWADTARAKSGLDIGTGTGLIALMLKQRCPSMVVSAVEIDKPAFLQAQQNISASPWPDISLIHGDILNFKACSQFDLIVSNPPFFNNSLKSDNQQRMLARHTDGLSFEKLTRQVAQLLSDNGRFCVVLPSGECPHFLAAASVAGLSLDKQLEVRTKANKAVKRVLLSLVHKQNDRDEYQRETLTIHDENGAYSTAYKTLCRNFYLNF